jgi:hypothetical protein
MIEPISVPDTTTTACAVKPGKRPAYGGSYTPVGIGCDLVSYYEKVPAVEMAVFCKCEMTFLYS